MPSKNGLTVILSPKAKSVKGFKPGLLGPNAISQPLAPSPPLLFVAAIITEAEQQMNK